MSAKNKNIRVRGKKTTKANLLRKAKQKKQQSNQDFYDDNEYSAENSRDRMSENYLGLPGFF
jgi:hypothetical protein